MTPIISTSVPIRLVETPFAEVKLGKGRNQSTWQRSLLGEYLVVEKKIKKLKAK